MLQVSRERDARSKAMERYEELTVTGMTIGIFAVSYGVLAAILYTML